MNKRLVSIILVVVLLGALATVFIGCNSNRETTLRIANWGEYMEKDVYEGFEKWYEDKTGESIKVEYNEFDTNENLYTWISAKKEDYDLICPSDYMLQRMIREGLLLKIDAETQEVINKSLNAGVINMVKGSYDPNMEYSMPYLWGTLGIMFNVNSDGQAGIQNELDTMNNWSALWDSNYKNKIFMKDSVRDAYTVAMLYDNANALITALGNDKNYDAPEYKTILNDIFDSTNTNLVNRAKELLLAQKENVYDYEVDSAKDELLRDVDGEKGYFGLFWSCDAGYIMNDENNPNKNLYYVIPEEGSNVWVDGFAIPKYAVNTKGANMFLQYMCEKDIAYQCMDYVGSTTAVNSAFEQYKADVILDEDGFFDGAYEGFKEMYVDMMFPSEETLKRCAIMKDFGEYNEALDEMWTDVGLA